MHVQKESIEKSIERLRAQGKAVPLAILAYDVETDRFQVCILGGHRSDAKPPRGERGRHSSSALATKARVLDSHGGKPIAFVQARRVAAGVQA